MAMAVVLGPAPCPRPALKAGSLARAWAFWVLLRVPEEARLCGAKWRGSAASGSQTALAGAGETLRAPLMGLKARWRCGDRRLEVCLWSAAVAPL